MQYALPLISIIVVNYNYGRFLEPCLASINAQTYENIECLVIDNASTDDSRQIYDRFVAGLPERRGERFGFHLMPENRHQTAASIEGFRRSKGHYVIFVDADDMLLPRCAKTHLQAHMSVRKCVGLTCGDMLQLTNDELVSCTVPGVANYVLSRRGRQPHMFRLLSEEIVESESLLENVVDLEERLHFVEPDETLCWPWSATSAFCYRREAVDLMFGYTPRMTGSTDAYLAHGITGLTGGLVIDLPVAIYRRHGGNLFSRYPSLNGLYDHDVQEDLVKLKSIVVEVIASYLANAAVIAARSRDRMALFDAIARIAAIADGLKPARLRVSSYLLEVLILHRAALEGIFGKDDMVALLRSHVRTVKDKVEVMRHHPVFRGREP